MSTRQNCKTLTVCAFLILSLAVTSLAMADERLNIVVAEPKEYEMTCKEIAAEWNIHDWATLADRINVVVDELKKMGVTLPVTVPPEGCSMIVEGPFKEGVEGGYYAWKRRGN